MSNVLRTSFIPARSVDWEKLGEGDSALARVEASLARKAGFREGYEKGRADGARATAAKVDSALRALDGARAKFEAAASGVVRAAGREMLLLALELARRVGVLRAEASPEVALGILEEAVEKLPGRDFTARLNPRDAAAAQEALGRLSDGGIRRIELVADEQVAPGGCVVTGVTGWVDGRLDSQLERLAEALLAAEGHSV